MKQRLCHQRDWNTSRLIVALPDSTDSAKARIRMFVYTGQYHVTSITQFVFARTAPNVKSLRDASALSKWLSRATTGDVCLLLVSSLTLPPFFLSALSTKFTDRVHFGITSPDVFDEVAGDEATPSTVGRYWLVTSGGRTEYARRRGITADRANEQINYDGLGSLLRWVSPDLNDAFVVSLVLVNLLAVTAVFDLRASPLQALVHLVWTLVKYNCCLLSGWMLLLAVSNRQPLVGLGRAGLALLRRLVLGWPGRTLLADAQVLLAPGYSWLTVTLYALFTGALYILRRRFWPQTLEEPEPWSEWFRFNRPMVVLNPGRPAFYRSASPKLSPRLRALLRQLNLSEYSLPGTFSYEFLFDLPVRALHSSEGRRCFRCTCVRALHLRSMASRLRERPCSRCGYSGSETATHLLACSVCLEMYHEGEQQCQLPCGHVYHRDCVFSWLLTDPCQTCPCCRWPAYSPKQAKFPDFFSP
uniref:RING-type domain-containing protein n=1 Tax=Plectus sambesii TaxID=2011161 RepID=A0A914VSB2_9BILA